MEITILGFLEYPNWKMKKIIDNRKFQRGMKDKQNVLDDEMGWKGMKNR